MTNQIRGMHTIIRNHKTSTHDFIFYADRLIRLVCVCISGLRLSEAIFLITRIGFGNDIEQYFLGC